MKSKLLLVAASLVVSTASTASAQVSCSALPAFASCTAYASGASVVFNNTKYTALAAIAATRDCPPSAPYDPSSDNWWANNGACSGGATATATRTATATATGTPTATATTSGATSTRTSTATAAGRTTATSTATATRTPTATATTSVTATPSSNGNDQLKFTYNTASETATTYTGHLLVGNPNASYVWNGSYFAIWTFDFQTTSTVTSMTSTNGAVSFTQANGLVTVDLTWQSLFPFGSPAVDMTFQATKGGATVLPTSFRAHYVRGEDIVYPAYAGLPSSWTRNKANLAAADLIANATSYYQTSVPASTSKLIVYTPQHPTQLILGQVMSVPYPVNTVNGVRIWIPTRLMAMGLGVVYEYYKLNPNYMVALGTKENFAAGFVTAAAGNSSNPTVIDGQTWYWPMVAHVDGPYQQESGNFNDTRSYFPDWLPPTANHDDYTSIQVNPEDLHWISAGISSGISITVTREQLNAVRGINYTQFMQQAKDPYAEFACVDYAYNRGINDFYSKKIFSTNRAAAIASSDISTDFGLSGFASHVETVRAIMDATNASTDIYDGPITWTDMQSFFARLRMFYGRGTPSDAEWAAMTADVQRAFNVLAAHWGGGHVSARYDFLTLLRVAEQYLPQPRQPRPTGEDWYYQTKNATP
jgi:hypothetical protein